MTFTHIYTKERHLKAKTLSCGPSEPITRLKNICLKANLFVDSEIRELLSVGPLSVLLRLAFKREALVCEGHGSIQP